MGASLPAGVRHESPRGVAGGDIGRPAMDAPSAVSTANAREQSAPVYSVWPHRAS